MLLDLFPGAPVHRPDRSVSGAAHPGGAGPTQFWIFLFSSMLSLFCFFIFQALNFLKLNISRSKHLCTLNIFQNFENQTNFELEYILNWNFFKSEQILNQNEFKN
jgi:hypothetical protein